MEEAKQLEVMILLAKKYCGDNLENAERYIEKNAGPCRRVLYGNSTSNRQSKIGQNVKTLFMQTDHKPFIGPGAVILSAVLFGTMPLMAKSAFALGSNAYTTAFGRFASGALVAFLLIVILPKQTLRIGLAQFRSLTVLSLFYATTPVLLYSSYQSIDSGLASTLHFTYPVAVMLLSALLFHERIGKKELLCAVLCMGGILLLYTPGAKAELSGIAVAALSGLVYAGYIVGLGRSRLQGLSVLTLAFWLSFLSAAELFVFSLCANRLLLQLPGKVWLPYFGLGIFATVLALALFQIGVFLCGPVKASLFSTFEPLTGVVIGILVFNEVLTFRATFGMILILSAVILLVMPTQAFSQRDVHHGK